MKFGIVGTGMIARIHAKAIAEIEGAELVACYDIDQQRADDFARQSGCRSYHDFAAFLDDPDMEIVNICTPSGLHRDAALPAAASGRHLVIEKPLEITVSRCLEIVEACEKYHVVLSGIFPSRFFDAARELKRAVGEGRFGRLSQGSAYVQWWREQSYYSQGGWKGKRALDGGGALMNQSIHAVDLLLWYMGPVRRLSAHTSVVGHEHIEVEDNAVAVLEFENGALGAIQGSTAVWPGFLKKIEVMGTAGSAILEEDRLAFWKFREEKDEDEGLRKALGGEASTPGGAADPAAIGHEGHRRQLVDVIEAIQTSRRPMVDGLEATRAVACIEAIYRSAERGGTPECPVSI